MTIDSMKDYLAAIGRYPLLSGEQEIQLSRQVKRMVELQAMEGERTNYSQDLDELQRLAVQAWNCAPRTGTAR